MELTTISDLDHHSDGGPTAPEGAFGMSILNNRMAPMRISRVTSSSDNNNALHKSFYIVGSIVVARFASKNIVIHVLNPTIFQWK